MTASIESGRGASVFLTSRPTAGCRSSSEPLRLGGLHVGLTVSDLDRAVDWYCRVLGLKEVHRQTGDNDYTRTLVDVPGAALRVAQLVLPGQGPVWPSSHTVELIERPNDVGASHLAFVIDDIEAICARIISSGAALQNPPVIVKAGINRGSRTCYLHDPDGHTLELMEYGAGRTAALRGEA
ncbi:VOC family protein [Streptomyces sp. NPDC058228]|uniref:VOC family protein n=1 Tax=Streptomyces sp. NPDC058228 TaxID=3346390 RepID=UPI0036E7DA7D